MLSLIQGANCVIHSIGRAIPMAVRRKMTEDEILMLKQNGAIAESANITNSPTINNKIMIGASHHFRCEYMYINSSFIKSISFHY